MDRPRRSTRQPAKAPTLVATAVSQRAPKRKPPAEVDPQKQLNTLLHSSKSDLTSLDMTTIINSYTWTMLSEESQEYLKMLLPRSAFMGYDNKICDDHPSSELLKQHAHVTNNGDGDHVDKSRLNAPEELGELDHTFFIDAHFQAAMRTFQNHLQLNWLTDAHQEKIESFQERIRNGTLAAPWKDEVWKRDNGISDLQALNSTADLGIHRPRLNRPLRSTSDIRLPTLLKEGIIRVGDILVYRRSFATSELIEKDCIIESTENEFLKIATSPGTIKSLPVHCLAPPTSSSSCNADSTELVSMTVTSPSMLETQLLDLDGRIEKARRPHGNAWKCLSVWKWRAAAEVFIPYDARGGRENHGTLYYLRGSYAHEL